MNASLQIFVALVASTGLLSAQNGVERRNIVFIMADDLGAGWVDYDDRHPEVNTPNLQRRAETGMVFARAYTAFSVCSPTRAACITGMSPAQIGIITHIPSKVGGACFTDVERVENDGWPLGTEVISLTAPVEDQPPATPADPALYSIGGNASVTFNAAVDTLKNPKDAKEWGSGRPKLNDGSNFTGIELPALGITAWSADTFGDSATTTWGVSTEEMTEKTEFFFSGGPGTTSADDEHLAGSFEGADLSRVTGPAKAAMIKNLGKFDGATAIGAKYDKATLTKSGWKEAELEAAGWQKLPER